MKSPTTYFRYSFLASFILFISIALLSLFISFFIPGLWKFEIHSLLFVALINLAFTAGSVFYYRVSINSQGMRCTNFWGKFYFAEWSTITDARSYGGFWTSGLQFLLVSTTQSSHVLWFPLFLHDMPRLTQMVTSYAGKSNPLAIQLIEKHTPARRSEKAEKQIKFAWQGGVIQGTLTLVFIIFDLVGYDFIIDVLEILSICLIFGLSFGIYKKSRIAAVVMLIYFVVSQALVAIELNKIPGILSWILLISYVSGVQGTFAHHKLRRTS